jgi:hypothetical protein
MLPLTFVDLLQSDRTLEIMEQIGKERNPVEWLVGWLVGGWLVNEPDT